MKFTPRLRTTDLVHAAAFGANCFAVVMRFSVYVPAVNCLSVEKAVTCVAPNAQPSGLCKKKHRRSRTYIWVQISHWRTLKLH